MSVDIVRVDDADADALKVFMARVIAEAVSREEPVFSETVANVNGNVDWWLLHPRAGVHLKAVDGDALVGVVLVKEFWNLCSLFVAPQLHGQGIGSKLLRAAVDQCRGRSPKGAILLNSAPKAVRFYASHGFVPRQSAQVLPPGYEPMELAL